jgi:allantoate deiminase
MHDTIAETIMERIAALARSSEEPQRLTRRFATPALREAQDQVAAWMQATGMQVRRDAIGNLIGRYAGERAAAPCLLLGSHLDSVRDAGNFDGPLGVLVALAAVERLHQRGLRLPFAIDVLAFADEEGLRYGTAYLGSKAIAGSFDPAYLDRTDADGIAMAEAIRAFGGDPDGLASARYDRSAVLAYCEVHIEQGPVLEAEHLPVGVVTAIVGQSRVGVSFTGMAGHAGTVPMTLRRDALCAAAEFVLRVERADREWPGLVATVGQLHVQPDASNVIPGLVELSLDVRHPDDAIRIAARNWLQREAESIAAARQVTTSWTVVQESPSTPCAPDLTDLLAQSVMACGYPARMLVSGAGHDGVALADLTRVAMLFVRCKQGVSHHPAESAAIEDVAVALAALERFIESLAERAA